MVDAGDSTIWCCQAFDEYARCVVGLVLQTFVYKNYNSDSVSAKENSVNHIYYMYSNNTFWDNFASYI